MPYICQPGSFYHLSFRPKRYHRLKVSTNYSWTTVDNVLMTDSLKIHVLISIFLDGGKPVINQLWPNCFVPLKCQSMRYPLVRPTAHLNNIFFQAGSAAFLFWISPVFIPTLSPACDLNRHSLFFCEGLFCFFLFIVNYSLIFNYKKNNELFSP